MKWWLDEEAKRSSESEIDDQGLKQARLSSGRKSRPAVPRAEEELKMVLVVNDELKMGKGKIGAQCAHASVGLVEKLHESGEVVRLQQWEELGAAKVCLRASDTQELRALAAGAREAGLPIYLVQDAGRTQVAPGSRTVLAIGPAAKSQIDKITGQLRLL